MAGLEKPVSLRLSGQAHLVSFLFPVLTSRRIGCPWIPSPTMLCFFPFAPLSAFWSGSPHILQMAPGFSPPSHGLLGPQTHITPQLGKGYYHLPKWARVITLSATCTAHVHSYPVPQGPCVTHPCVPSTWGACERVKEMGPSFITPSQKKTFCPQRKQQPRSSL